MKGLCNDWRNQLTPDPTFQSGTRTQPINLMWANLETVISDSKRLKRDVNRQHQSGIGLDAPLCLPEQDSAALSNLDVAKVNEPLQRYELFLLFQVKYTTCKRMSANSLGER